METVNFLSSHGDLRLDARFSDITTIRIGGPIKYLVSPFDINRLKVIVKYLNEEGIPYKVVGRGSNLICGDDLYDGCVIRLEHLDHYSFDSGKLYVEAGMMIPRLCNVLASQGLSNLEFASGIPGTLGGLVFMNAGAYKRTMSDIIDSVTVLRDGEIVEMSKEECRFSYRHSIFHEHLDWIILAATLNMERSDPKEIKDLMADRLTRRKATQPLDKPSAGSCFKNPEGDYAWRLIDGVGLRGYEYHGILVSDKHPNFILNIDDARADDFITTTNFIKAKVKDTYGVDLIMEVELFNC